MSNAFCWTALSCPEIENVQQVRVHTQTADKQCRVRVSSPDQIHRIPRQVEVQSPRCFFPQSSKYPAIPSCTQKFQLANRSLSPPPRGSTLVASQAKRGSSARISTGHCNSRSSVGSPRPLIASSKPMNRRIDIASTFKAAKDDLEAGTGGGSLKTSLRFSIRPCSNESSRRVSNATLREKSGSFSSLPRCSSRNSHHEMKSSALLESVDYVQSAPSITGQTILGNVHAAPPPSCSRELGTMETEGFPWYTISSVRSPRIDILRSPSASSRASSQASCRVVPPERDITIKQHSSSSARNTLELGSSSDLFIKSDEIVASPNCSNTFPRNTPELGSSSDFFIKSDEIVASSNYSTDSPRNTLTLVSSLDFALRSGEIMANSASTLASNTESICEHAKLVNNQHLLPMKLVVFDFDCTLSVWHIFHVLSGTRPNLAVPPPYARTEGGQLSRISELDDTLGYGQFASMAFGGSLRVARLKGVLESLCDAGVECIVISRGMIGTIRKCLDQLRLLSFFSEIFGNIGSSLGASDYDTDTPYVGSDEKYLGGLEMEVCRGVKAELIASSLKKRGLEYAQVMLLDDDLQEVRAAHSVCISVHVAGWKGVGEKEFKLLSSRILSNPNAASKLIDNDFGETLELETEVECIQSDLSPSEEEDHLEQKHSFRQVRFAFEEVAHLEVKGSLPRLRSASPVISSSLEQTTSPVVDDFEMVSNAFDGALSRSEWLRSSLFEPVD